MAHLHVLKVKEMDFRMYSYSELKTARGFRLFSKAYRGRTFKIVLQNTTKKNPTNICVFMKPRVNIKHTLI